MRRWATTGLWARQAAAEADPAGGEELHGRLCALAQSVAAVCRRLARVLRQDGAQRLPSAGAALFVAAALGGEEALWIALCCQVPCRPRCALAPLVRSPTRKPQPPPAWLEPNRDTGVPAQAWGEQAAKARKRRGGREGAAPGGTLLDRSVAEDLAAVQGCLRSGLQVRCAFA